MVTSGGSADPAVAPLLNVGFGDIPAYCFITELRLTIKGNSTYVGTPVSKLTMAVRLREFPMSQAGATTVSSAIDPATYGGSPSMTDTRDVLISLSSNPMLVDKSLYHYHVAIAGEFGTNAKRYVHLCSLRATIQQPTV
jgi:hypothetical protein